MPEEIIEIRNGVASVVTRTETAHTSAAAFLKALEKETPAVLLGAPRGLHSFSLDPATDTGVMVLEVRPRRYTVVFEDRYEDESETRTFDLSFPWLYFRFVFMISSQSVVSSQVYMAPRRATEATDPLWFLPFPNIFSDGEICWGDVSTTETRFYDKLAERVNLFFSSELNDDLDVRTPHDFADDFGTWALSRANPETWSHWTVYPNDTRLGRLLHGPERATELLNWTPPVRPRVFYDAAENDEFVASLSPTSRRRLRAALARHEAAQAVSVTAERLAAGQTSLTEELFRDAASTAFEEAIQAEDIPA